MRVAFEPNREDTDGLSLYREAFITPAALATFCLNPKGCYVLRSKAAQVYSESFGDDPLKIVPSKADIPGHCIIPQLKRSSYKSSASKDLQVALARIFEKDVAYRPKGSV